jgi:hypothetical protein
MTKILEITNRTTDAEIDNAIPFEDMRKYAKYVTSLLDGRDLLLNEYDDQIYVLWDCKLNVGFANQVSSTGKNSLPDCSILTKKTGQVSLMSYRAG